MDNILNTLSFNQSIMETIVIIGIAAVVIGTIVVMYWHYIVAGLAAFFCIVVLANHKTPPTETASTPVKIEQSLKSDEKLVEPPPPPVIGSIEKPVQETPVVPVPPVVEVKPVDEHQAYLQDCMRLTNYEYETCDLMWQKRQNGSSEDVKYRKRNKNYMMKVAGKI